MENKDVITKLQEIEKKVDEEIARGEDAASGLKDIKQEIAYLVGEVEDMGE